MPDSLSFSFSCSEPEFDELGRASIAVDQPPGGGDNYPFSNACDIDKLIADLYLAFQDDDCEFVPPFRIQWLFGFGCAEGDVPDGDMPHLFDMLIVDDADEPVFDTRTANEPEIVTWGTRLEVIQWVKNQEILRVVRFLKWQSEDEPRNWPYYQEPEGALLDARTHSQIPLHLNSFRVAFGGQLSHAVVFQNGYNTTLETVVPTRVDGGRFETVLLVEAVAGSGDGRYGPACFDDTWSPVRRIAGRGPDNHGNYLADASECYRIERPVLSILSQSQDESQLRHVLVQNHTIQIFNDCGPCCECQDFLNVYEAIRQLRDRYASLIKEVGVLRDLYVQNLARFQAERDCRARDVIRITLQPRCPGELGLAVGICNNTDECLTNVVVPVSFQYADTTGLCDDLTATTTYGETPLIICGNTLRSGNSSGVEADNNTPSHQEPYSLGGAWPHYYLMFNAIQPGAMGTVSWRLMFPDAVSGDRIELIADAYWSESPRALDPVSGFPIPAYTPGSGPANPSIRIDRLVDCPKKASAEMLVEPCCEEA